MTNDIQLDDLPQPFSEGTVEPDALDTDGDNPNEMSDEQFGLLCDRMEENGWLAGPIITNEYGLIADGEQRWRAAQEIGLTEVPVRKYQIDDATRRLWRQELNKIKGEHVREYDATEYEYLLSEGYQQEVEELAEAAGEDLDDLLDDIQEQPVEPLDTDPLADKALEDIKILNLYAGIGGNRWLWGDQPDVTAVEYNETIAEAYQDLHPEDTVVVADAHEYLRENFADFDFIWSSPPCPTHSKIRKNIRYEAGQNDANDLSETDPVFPDLQLYEEIIFLDNYLDGYYCVENVIAYYEPLIEPQEVNRHYFWSNFDIPDLDLDLGERKHDNQPKRVEQWLDIDLSGYTFPSEYPKGKVLNNLVHPELGQHILTAMLETPEQATLDTDKVEAPADD